MILQALYEYYERKAADPENQMAPLGFEWKEIPFLIVIDKNGKFVRLEDTRQGEGNKKTSKQFLLPQGEKRASGIKPNFLWDGPEYVLGANYRNRDDVIERHQSFIKRMHATLDKFSDRPVVTAVLDFLDDDPLQQVLMASGDSAAWNELIESNANLTFFVEGEGFVVDQMKDLVANWGADEDSQDGLCLITGQKAKVTRIHPAIKGVWGGQPAGAALVSFQINSGYDSYHKTQNYNAPISKRGTFAYTAALNSLLAKGSENRLQLGDSSTVFWAQKKNSTFEKQVKTFFAAAAKEKDDPDSGAVDAKQSLQSILTGIPTGEQDSLFYILGLSPNAARVSVRFWHAGTIAQFVSHMQQHLDDLDIVAPKNDPERMGLTYLLGSTVLDWKSENIPPNLAGNVIQAILNNSPYPETLLQQCMRRIRALREVGRVRAAILKACTNRKLRRSNPNNEKEITVSLDISNKNPGYRLGRLFAVLEKIQEDANPGLNATIRDRFYGAASSNPVAVFPQLLKLKNHHIAKLDNAGFKIAHERRLTEIMDGFGTEMPAHLTMDEQARFAIGYYHQRQALFTSSKVQTNTQGEQK